MASPRPGTRAHLQEVARRLEEQHGPRRHRRRHDPVSELVTTLLSHSTTDENQRRALAALRARWPAWEDVRRAPLEEVARAIRPAGLAGQKAPRILAALEAVAAEPRGTDLEWLGDVPLDEAMAYLTALPGVGPKTAACVMCFCFDAPVVPVDTHVHRIALRTRMVPPRTPAARAQEVISRRAAPGTAYALHVLLIAHGRAVCRARAPRCAACRLLELCPHGRRREGAGTEDLRDLR